MMGELESLLCEILVERAGFEEIDDDPAPLISEDDGENFKFANVLSMLGYLLDKMCRRSQCVAPDSKYLRSIYAIINKSEIFKKLASEKDIGGDSFKLLTDFFKSIPVIALPTKPAPKFVDELAELIKDGLQCIQNFYLEHDNQN